MLLTYRKWHAGLLIGTKSGDLEWPWTAYLSCATRVLALLFSLVSCVKPNGLLSASDHAILCWMSYRVISYWLQGTARTSAMRWYLLWVMWVLLTVKPPGWTELHLYIWNLFVRSLRITTYRSEWTGMNCTTLIAESRSATNIYYENQSVLG